MNDVVRSFSREYRRALLFFGVPLWVELAVYLLPREIRPDNSALPGVLLVFLYTGCLFAALSAPLAWLITRTSLRIEILMPGLYFGLFTALTASRLLPYHSGIAPARLAVFAASIAAALAACFLLSRQKAALSRLLFGEWMFCAIAAYSLGYLFEFPLHNGIAVFVLFPALFAGLFLLPWKVLALAGAFFLALQFQTRTVLPSFAPPAKLEPFRRVILIGIDGLSPEVVYEMAAAGKLPAFQQIIKQGVSGKLHTLRVPYSPLVWNTIYTGTEPRNHGIMAFTRTGVAGAEPFLTMWLDNWTNSDWIHRSVDALQRTGALRIVSPATARNRKAAALWNMMDQNNTSSIVAGGWTTYPPEVIRGTFVSDYAATAGHTIGTYHPVSKTLDEMIAYQPDVSSGPPEIQRYLAKDERMHRIATHLLREAGPETRFIFSYYCAVDAYGHHFGTYINRKATQPGRRQQLLQIREEVYRNADRYLRDYIHLLDGRTLLMVCSDHGFYFDKRQHNYPVDGMLLLMGPGIRNDTTIEESVGNIAPTVMYALGLPSSIAFQGRPSKQAFEGIIPELPARKYDPATRFLETAVQPELDEQKLQELEDLQYINR